MNVPTPELDKLDDSDSRLYQTDTWQRQFTMPLTSSLMGVSCLPLHWLTC